MANVLTEKVEELLKEGKSASEIGKQFNISRQAVYYHINKLKKKEEKNQQKNKKSNSSKPKKDYNSLINWNIYNEGLVKRGEILLNFDFFQDWQEQLDLMNKGKAGRPYDYPESFILFLSRLKSIFKIDYRTLEGITRKLIHFIPEAEKTPDYSTLQVRFTSSRFCELEVYQDNEEQEIAGDSSGLKTSNRGEYRMNKYRGERKKFIKLHIAVNTKTRQVVGCSVTLEETRDHEEMSNIMAQAQRHGKIRKGLFDGAYDNNNSHWELKEEGIKPVIKPRKTMKLERVKVVIEEESKRIKTIKDKKQKEKIQKRIFRLNILKKYLQDKEKWEKENGYRERWKAESRYSVFKRIFGEHVFSKKIENIRNETVLKVSLMNLFTSLTIGAIKAGYMAT